MSQTPVEELIHATSTFCFIVMIDLLESLGQGIVPGIIVLIYLLVVKWLEHNKETREEAVTNNIDKRINTLTNHVSDIVESLSEVSMLLRTVTSNIIERDKEKCKFSIELAFSGLAKELSDFAFITIVNNHIDTNSSIIKNNIRTAVNSEYYKVYSVLGLYEYNGKRINEHLKEEWKKELIEALDISLFKDDADGLTKMNTFRTKVNLIAKNCSNYVYNNTFN